MEVGVCSGVTRECGGAIRTTFLAVDPEGGRKNLPWAARAEIYRKGTNWFVGVKTTGEKGMAGSAEFVPGRKADTLGLQNHPY